jgi:hypothetical protein
MNITLPHYVQMALGLASVILVWVMQQQSSGALVLPAAVVSGLVILKTIIGLLSPSISGPTNILAGQRAQNALKVPS